MTAGPSAEDALERSAALLAQAEELERRPAPLPAGIWPWCGRSARA